MKTRDTIRISDSKWTGYAAAGLATLSLSATSAEADITHVVLNNGNGILSSPGDDNYFSLGNGSSLNFYHPAAASDPDIGGAFTAAFNGSSSTGSMVGFSASGFNYASNLEAGLNISTLNFLPAASGTMAIGYGYYLSQFLNAGTGYVGFRFNNQQQYGWARVTMLGSQPDNSFVIEEYAYGDIGDSIFAGQTAVPEPSALGILACGAVGLAALRRRRKTA